ncbi:hypothetical protein D3C77_744730 [compost metagenome]
MKYSLLPTTETGNSAGASAVATGSGMPLPTSEPTRPAPLYALAGAALALKIGARLWLFMKYAPNSVFSGSEK